ncbi:MAG: efflux transporter periplasmic adaptor subunit [Bacteroidetes bacterium]|nr:MAG: efflux transporter periplasmic adaptor subunit [Bacteroidota bacterium]PIE88774.1 MAG: efflux transporter periplasmic adaptor subunit [Bacteroidota bacterium]
MKKNVLMIFSILMLVMVGCNNQATTPAEKEIKIPTVKTAIAQQNNYDPVLRFSGTMVANREANLGSALPGRVEKCFYPVNKNVKAGELLIKLSGELLHQAEAENNAIQKDYDRVARLYEKGSVTAQQYDHVSAKLEASNAKTTMMRNFSEIRAPFDGTIVDYIVNEGEVYAIAPGLKPGYSYTSGVVRLMQLDTVKIAIEVPQVDFHHIHLGQEATVSMEALGDTTFTAVVTRILPYFSTVTRTATVELSIPNPDRIIYPGMYAEVAVNMPSTTGIFVPQESIFNLSGTGQEYVFALQGTHVKRLSVKRVFNVDDMVAVEGIDNGTTILTTGIRKVYDGSEVNVIR